MNLYHTLSHYHADLNLPNVMNKLLTIANARVNTLNSSLLAILESTLPLISFNFSLIALAISGGVT